MVNKKRGLEAIRGPMVGLASFASLSFAAAKLAEEGILPMEATVLAMLFSLLLSSLIAGACSGGAGKRGLCTGCVLAFLYLLGKAIFHSDVFFTLGSLYSLLCIVLGAWLGSCLFHNKAGCYTKRNRKNRRRNYK
mgnify:CR=1 FL=1